MKKELNAINSLRFIFIFLIFIHHFDVFKLYNDKLFLENWIFEAFIGVQFFFILSGFVCSYGYKSKIITNKVLKEEFLIKRVKKIYPIYMITMLLSIIIYKISLQDVLSSVIPFLFLVQSFVPLDGFAFKFNGVAWCISNLFFFYIIFLYFLKLPLRKLLWSYVIFMLAIITIIIKFNITEELGTWFYYVNPVFRFIDFFSGVLLYEIYLRIQQYITRKKATILEFISILMLLIFMYIGISKIPLIYRWDIYYIFPISFLILVFSFDKGFISKILNNSLLKKLGKISMEFYLIHQIVLVFLVQRFYFSIGSFPELKIILMAMCISVLFSYLLNKYISKDSIFLKLKKRIK